VNLDIVGLGYRFGELPVFENLNLQLPGEQVTCVLGPSGCGKSTLLNLISGLLPLQEGEIRGLDSRRTGYIFQEPRLLPWKTVRENLELVLINTVPAAGRKAVLDKVLGLVGLDEFRDFYPGEISGGMRQRVSLARAFVYPSSLLLLDEPFQALDPVFKLSLMGDFLKLWREDKRSCLLVTHNIQEAALLGESIVVLSSRPSRVLRVIRNPVLPEQRIPYGRPVLELEHELYAVLAGAEPS